MIVDAHCHAGLGDRLTAPANTAARLGAYLRRARAAGIDRTVVMPAFHSDYATANAALARLVARARGRLIGFVMVHPDSDAGRIAEMVRTAVDEWGFRGIKVHGHDAFPTREVCTAARRHRIPGIDRKRRGRQGKLAGGGRVGRPVGQAQPPLRAEHIDPHRWAVRIRVAVRPIFSTDILFAAERHHRDADEHHDHADDLRERHTDRPVGVSLLAEPVGRPSERPKQVDAVGESVGIERLTEDE